MAITKLSHAEYPTAQTLHSQISHLEYIKKEQEFKELYLYDLKFSKKMRKKSMMLYSMQGEKALPEA